MMAENAIAIASAVVLPEPEMEQTDMPRASKRRQSSSPDPSTKRPRLSTEGDLDSPSTLRASPNVSPPVADLSSTVPKDASLGRKDSNAQEERKRGRRLFGGLLNTLSQSASDAQQKKRLEIEQRQQEKARLQKAEDESRRAERLQRLREVRTRQQVKLDEKSMRIRHSNMLAMAQFLCTKSEPKLYYKPWELLPGDAERIKEQIANTEALIEHELQEFNKRHKTDLQPDERPTDEVAKNEVTETQGEHHAESSSVPRAAASDSTNPLPTVQAHDLAPAPAPDPAQLQRPSLPEKDPSEENGEVVVEGDEDTVIY